MKIIEGKHAITKKNKTKPTQKKILKNVNKNCINQKCKFANIKKNKYKHK